MERRICNFIESPIFEGGVSRGTEQTYNKVKKAINAKTESIFTDYIENDSFRVDIDSSQAKNCSEVLTKCKGVKENIVNSFENGNFPLIIGGDHSTAIASLYAGSEVFGIDDYAVIYIDGHTDINTEKTSLTHNLHGMPLAFSLGLCPALFKIGNLKKTIEGKNVFIIGARSIDEKEFEIIKKNDVVLYKNTSFINANYSSILKEIVNAIGTKKVHISLDVDVLDSKIFQSTNYVLDNGLSLEQVTELLYFFFENLNIVSAEIVEYNPLLDRNNNDFEKVLFLIKEIEMLIKKEK